MTQNKIAWRKKYRKTNINAEIKRKKKDSEENWRRPALREYY